MALTEYAKGQYQFIKGSRAVLLEYCKTISTDDFVNRNTSFGRGGSMRNLLVHIVNTYQFWIANVSLQKNIGYPKYEEFGTIEEVTKLFDEVDNFMHEFIEALDTFPKEIPFQINGKQDAASAFQLFSHAITHEFHHKGQVLSISRHLGYTPVDTDIMR